VSARTKPDYRYSLSLIADVRTKRGGRFGELHVDQISAAVVDRLYTKHLLHSKDRQTKAGKVLPGRMRRRQAELCIVIMKQAWNVIHRLYPKVVAKENPWVGVTLEGGKEEIVAASREEAFALSAAIAEYGHPHLAAVPLICFEWLQRPENVLAGHLAWHDVRAKGNPKHVRIDHHKTGKKVLQPLEDKVIQAWVMDADLRNLKSIGRIDRIHFDAGMRMARQQHDLPGGPASGEPLD
jgi:hypothetical protein